MTNCKKHKTFDRSMNVQESGKPQNLRNSPQAYLGRQSIVYRVQCKAMGPRKLCIISIGILKSSGWVQVSYEKVAPKQTGKFT